MRYISPHTFVQTLVQLFACNAIAAFSFDTIASVTSAAALLHQPLAIALEELPSGMRAFNVAVVGGGLGGLTCATKLLELLPQTKATVFDMGMRGPGALPAFVPKYMLVLRLPCVNV